MHPLFQRADDLGISTEHADVIINAVTRDAVDEVAIYGAIRREDAWRERTETTIMVSGNRDADGKDTPEIGGAIWQALRSLKDEDFKVFAHAVADEIRNRDEMPRSDKPNPLAFLS